MSNFFQDDNTDQIDLLDAEKHNRLSLTVRAWFVFSALDFAGNNLAFEAFKNYQSYLERWMSLYTNVSRETLYARLEEAKKEMFYHDYAEITLGTSAIKLGIV